MMVVSNIYNGGFNDDANYNSDNDGIDNDDDDNDDSYNSTDEDDNNNNDDEH